MRICVGNYKEIIVAVLIAKFIGWDKSKVKRVKMLHYITKWRKCCGNLFRCKFIFKTLSLNLKIFEVSLKLKVENFFRILSRIFKNLINFQRRSQNMCHCT